MELKIDIRTVMIMRTATSICLLLMAFTILAIPVASQAQVAVGISIRVGPPLLPVYVQPPVPAPGYIWTPGYWAYGPDGYYWVPGTWVEPPVVGVLWTPGYWGWREGFYVWSPGYWGPHVGFYGGINYGFGYTGVGFVGGAWRGGVFSYNRSVTNVNTTIIHNTYNTTVINNNTTINRTSFNGGAGGVRALPTGAEQNAMREHHFESTTAQVQHHQAAGSNRALLASVNHGSPAIAASPRPGVFNGQGVVAANKNANFNRPATNNAVTAKSGGNRPNFANKTFKGNGQNAGSQSTYKPGRTYYGNAKVTTNNTSTNASHSHNRDSGQHGNDSHSNNSRSNDKSDRR